MKSEESSSRLVLYTQSLWTFGYFMALTPSGIGESAMPPQPLEELRAARDDLGTGLFFFGLAGTSLSRILGFGSLTVRWNLRLCNLIGLAYAKLLAAPMGDP